MRADVVISSVALEHGLSPAVLFDKADAVAWALSGGLLGLVTGGA